MGSPARETAKILRLTVADYRRMGEAGILRANQRTKLVDGEIVDSGERAYALVGAI